MGKGALIFLQHKLYICRDRRPRRSIFKHKSILIHLCCLYVFVSSAHAAWHPFSVQAATEKGERPPSFRESNSPSYAEFMLPNARFAQYVSYKFTLKRGISFVSLFLHRCETRLLKGTTDLSHISPSFYLGASPL